MLDTKKYIDNIMEDKGMFYGEVKPSFILEFQERCFIITGEKLREELRKLGLVDTIFINIITEETKDLPLFLDKKRVFLFYEQKPRKNSIVSKTIESLINKIFPDEEFDLQNRKGLSSLIRPPVLKNIFEENYEDILNILEHIDDTSKELYIRILTVLKNGRKSLLTKYISPIFKIYNELIVPSKGDLVVSGGLYNSLEVRRILNQIGTNGKLLGFEPSKPRYLEMKNLSFNNLSIKQVALGETHKSFVYFEEENGGRSKIDKNGKYEVPITTIDIELNNEKCNLIKLNINGYELEALKGAKVAITKHKPKLQILLTINNLISIPKLLLEYNNKYHFYLGYYDQFNNLDNILLYAI